MTCCNMSLWGFVLLEDACLGNHCDLGVDPHWPSGMSIKCSPPPNNPRGQGLSLSCSFTKSISVRESCW